MNALEEVYQNCGLWVDDPWIDSRIALRDAIKTFLAAAEAEGWKLVPVRMTDGVLAAAEVAGADCPGFVHTCIEGAWAAMVEAAPKYPLGE